jgi:hypothetical protein
VLRRRIAALLSTALMFHLTLAASDAACAAHGTQMAHAGHRMPSMPQMPGMPVSERESGSTDDQPPCDAPTRPECCQSMTSCAFSVAIGWGASSERAWDGGDRIAPGTSPAPSSRVVAPEPPPPKP